MSVYYLTTGMLNIIKNRIKEKLLSSLPLDINLIPFVTICEERKEVFCVFSGKGDIHADIYLKKNAIGILELITDTTDLEWCVNYEKDGDIVYILKSGYVTYSDGIYDIYAYYKIIDGCELDLDSYWSFEQSKPAELRSDDLAGWEYDLECFDFERRRPDGL